MEPDQATLAAGGPVDLNLAKYDLSGRVFNGVPVPYNLPVPPYRYVNATTLRIGENPPDSQFDFSSIRQI